MMRLLDFVALYGLILMPMGAVILADFWILPRMGLRSNYAEWNALVFSWPAAASWGLTLAACWLFNAIWDWQIFFLGLPGWFIATGIFVAMSALQQRREGAPTTPTETAPPTPAETAPTTSTETAPIGRP